MVTIEQIKEYTKCPQFGDADYGKWGALTLEQRRAYRYLIDIIDGLDQEIKRLNNESIKEEYPKVFVKIITDHKHEAKIMDLMELANFLNVKFWIPNEIQKLIDSEDKDILFVRRGNDSNAIIKYKFLDKE